MRSLTFSGVKIGILRRAPAPGLAALGTPTPGKRNQASSRAVRGWDGGRRRVGPSIIIIRKEFNIVIDVYAWLSLCSAVLQCSGTRARVLHEEAKNYKSGRQVQVHPVRQAIVMKNSQNQLLGGAWGGGRRVYFLPSIRVYTAL